MDTLLTRAILQILLGSVSVVLGTFNLEPTYRYYRYLVGFPRKPEP